MPKKNDHQRTPSRKVSPSRSRRRGPEIEDLVRAGVERFMLKHATIYDFQKMMRSAARSERGSRHPLTRAVFSRIVRTALRKRNDTSRGG